MTFVNGEAMGSFPLATWDQTPVAEKLEALHEWLLQQ